MSRPQWNLERVVSELRQLDAGGETISYGALRAAGYGALLHAAERYIGSFSRAVRLAGVERAYQPWTRVRILGEIRKLHQDGESLSCHALRVRGMNSLVVAARKFYASWPLAVIAAGIPRAIHRRWKTWKQILDQLRELHDRGVRMSRAALSAEGFSSLYHAATRVAGSWNAALAKARIPQLQRTPKRRTRAEVVAELRALDARGVVLNSGQLIRSGHRGLVRAATSYFGTWTAARRAAVPRHKPLVSVWTMDSVLARIRARYRAGLSVRSTDVLREEKTLTAAAWRLGIPWKTACKRAGIPAAAIAVRKPPHRIRWTRAQAIDELRAAARDGRPILGRTFSRGFVQVLIRRFGSWPAAIEAAGLSRRHAADLKTARANRFAVHGGRDANR